MILRNRLVKISILAMILILATGLFAYGVLPQVSDEAGLFSNQEMEEIEKAALDLRDKLQLDIVIVTTNDNKGKTSRDYADDFYDEGGFGFGDDADGVLLLINMEDREVYISTTGIAIRYLTDARLDSILDKIYTHLGAGDYAEGVRVFLKEIDYYVGLGIPQGQYNQEEKVPATIGQRLISYFFISIVIGAVAVAIMSRSNKGKSTVRENTYMENNSFNIVNSIDRHRDTSVTHVVIQSSSSKGSGNRSTVHRSSSGRSHGGRGRKF